MATSSQDNTAIEGHVLIVFAHQDRRSFNGALLDKAEAVLQSRGHHVEVSDLYQMNFEPRATRSDFEGYVEDGSFSYNRASEWGMRTHNISSDVSAEMSKLQRAQLLVLQFPLYWGSVPAILKGWLDRVLVSGFAHHFASGRVFNEGLMKGKKACLSLTTGATTTMYSDSGVNGDINVSLWPLHAGLQFCGFDVLNPQISFAPELVDEAERVQMVERWGQRLGAILDEASLSFLPLSAFSPDRGYRLSPSCPEFRARQAPTPGQHLGKPLPRNQPESEEEQRPK